MIPHALARPLDETDLDLSETESEPEPDQSGTTDMVRLFHATGKGNFDDVLAHFHPSDWANMLIPGFVAKNYPAHILSALKDIRACFAVR
jgi:hypothetical protein